MADKAIDLRGIVGVLRRQLKLILLSFVLVMVAASVTVYSLKPAYTASTMVLADPSRKDLLDPEATVANAGTDSARIDSEVEMVKSQPTLMQVVLEEKLLTDPAFEPKLGLRDQLMSLFRIGKPTLPTGEDALNEVVGNLAKAVSVQRRGLTYLIVISAQAGDRNTAARIANAVANSYIRSQVSSKTAAIDASRAIIDAQIADANAAVIDSEGAFDAFIAQNISRITSETGRADIAQLRDELASIDANKSRLATQLAEARDILSQRDYPALASALQSEALQGLEAQQAALQTQLAAAASGSDTAINLQAELDRLQANLSDQAQVDITTLQQSVATAQSSATDLRTKLRTTILSGNLPADILASLYTLQQTSEIARSHYQTLIVRSQDLKGQTQLQVADSRVISPAVAPVAASFPNPRLILTLAAFFAAGLGVGLAFLVENFVGGFTSEDQLKAVLRTSVAATIPQHKTARKPNEPEPLSAADAVITSPLSVFAESVRRLRHGVDQSLRRPGGKSNEGAVVMVTSASANEGKTTTSLSLARAYGMSGGSVILIDCDLQKPSIHRHIGMKNSTGLMEYLLGGGAEVELRSILKIDPLSNVHVAVGAHRSEVATDQLLTARAFARLIAAARKSFDIVVLDTPPIGQVVDGLYIAPFADAIVFVTRWASTSQRAARNALTAVEAAKLGETPVLSVLAQQEISKTDYRGRGADSTEKE